MAKILVIDDSEELLEIFSLILTWKGYEAKTISSQDKVHVAIADFSPDLILLDVMFGDFDGRDLCKEIKESDAKNIPIILISANPGFLKNYEECHADAVVEKPFDIQTAINQINTVLTKYQPIPVN